MSDDIPLELQIEMMKRLPVKSLIQFRSVSKPWKSIIDSSEFVTDYNNNHAHHSNQQQIVVEFYDESFVYMIDDDYDPSMSLLKIPFNKQHNYLIGYTQGLFAFYTYNDSPTDDAVAVIWNPSIRKSVDILLERPYTVVGFGVCNATDPMIVKINFDYRDIAYQVGVFTLSSGVWRSLSNTNSLPHISLQLTSETTVVIDKFIYWMALKRTLKRNLIVSFDMTSEKFAEISLPPGLANSRSGDLELSKLGESLVVLQVHIHAKPEYDVWMMKMMEDGVQYSFEKLYNVKLPNASTLSILGFSKTGQPVIEVQQIRFDKQKVLAVYEPDSKHFNDIGIFVKENIWPRGSYMYMGSLLLLDH